MRESIDDVSTGTNLSNLNPGSKTRALLEAINARIRNAYGDFDLSFARAFLSGATGKYLDFIGELLNVNRLGAAGAIIPSAAQNVKFYVVSGTFGDINSGTDIVVPAGTIIKNRATGDAVRYKTSVPVTLLSTASETFVAVESLVVGQLANVGLGSIKFHEFENYSDTLNSTLKVLNIASITAGREIEDDINYRFRIANGVLSGEKGNATAVRIAALSTPGVANAMVTPYAQGIGTYDVLLQSITPTVTTQLISAVENSLLDITALGSLFRVRGPQEFGIEIEVTLTLRENLDLDGNVALADWVDISLVDYINNFDIGNELIINQLIEIVLGTDERIKNVGVTSKPIDFVGIYKPTKLSDNKIREELLDDFAPPEDGRVIIEPSVADPVRVRIR